MSVKPYIQGILVLIGMLWGMLAIFAVVMWTWFDWMTWVGVGYSVFLIALGAAFYLVDRRSN